ncbi:segregation and condensation protein A [Zavarzinella formosa]|uniref:segregation and condensation protein A n=1 Tax=Zavarzinella formosa TaxID=360055 RepID=UPI0002E071B3|nr:segregation/condensation protein A [Zavarzinella formosa]
MYQINLEAYHGPLDLLLYLVRKNEVDILDIPIAKIAAEFFDYLQLIQTIDIEWAGDFLVLAATLMEIKSRMLLPQKEEQPDKPEDDPRREIVRQLIEYRRTKEAAGELERLAEERQFHVARTMPEDNEGATSPRFRPVEMWDLVSAFARLLRETHTHQILEIGSDDTPQSSYREMIRVELGVRGRLSLAEVITPPLTRVRLIGYFLAILELLKQGEVTLEQPDEFGMIWLTPLAMPRLAREPDETSE